MKCIEAGADVETRVMFGGGGGVVGGRGGHEVNWRVREGREDWMLNIRVTSFSNKPEVLYFIWKSPIN